VIDDQTADVTVLDRRKNEILYRNISVLELA